MNIAANFLQRKYALPDKAVASQILMYRQLLHTECKPGLRLSREYQGTVAQKKVMFMPVRLYHCLFSVFLLKIFSILLVLAF